MKRISGLIYEETRGVLKVMINDKLQLGHCHAILVLKGFLGERHPRCCHLHRARQEEDCDCHGRSIRPEEAGQDLVRLWRIDLFCSCDM